MLRRGGIRSGVIAGELMATAPGRLPILCASAAPGSRIRPAQARGIPLAAELVPGEDRGAEPAEIAAARPHPPPPLEAPLGGAEDARALAGEKAKPESAAPKVRDKPAQGIALGIAFKKKGALKGRHTLFRPFRAEPLST